MLQIEEPEITETARAGELSQMLGAPEVIAALLLQRGIETEAAAHSFFTAELIGDHRPGLFKGYDEVFSLLAQVRESRSAIMVHGDYDVDGIAGTAIMYMGLRKLGCDVHWYLPDRFKDGYGITSANIRRFHESGIEWLITVDTGISAVEETQTARSLGMKVIITDHHQAPEILPPAEVIINPHQIGCAYPNKHLCGAAIAFKIINGLYIHFLGRPADEYLDLVALASMADSVPSSGENRTLIRKGLLQLKSTAHPGLAELLARLVPNRDHITSEDIQFRVIPVLNAPGRLSSPDLAFQLLTADSASPAGQIADSLITTNYERKQLDNAVYSEAVRMVESSTLLKNAHCLVLDSPGWHEGVIGIVAAKLVDRYLRPVFILSVKSGIAKGSGRTVEGFNLHEAVREAAPLLEKWGGHYYACGFSIRAEHIPAFRDQMARLAESILKEKSGVRTVHPSVRISLNDIDENLLHWLSQFEPFGNGNENPLFFSSGLRLSGSPRVVGGEHLKFSVSAGGRTLGAIAFGMGDSIERLMEAGSFKLAYHPEWNIFRGMKTIQLRVTAFEPEDA